MTPTQALILEILAARKRLGDFAWTFDARHNHALNKLEADGYIGQKAGVIEHARFAWLTPQGDNEVFYSDPPQPDALLVYAFRYALGRQTYAVTDVVSELIRRAPAMTQKDRELITREITDAIRLNLAGAPADERDWARAREAMTAFTKLTSS